ncbi:MAG: serine hydrolase, partial [Spirochaetales bacterium]|nr:serine hydrolase [Spirochaetales bacterium]
MKIKILLAMVITIVLTGCASINLDYYPTNAWKYSTPEAQGMDSGILADSFTFMIKEKTAINSMIVVKNGYIVAEAYRYPYTEASHNHFFSCTKSVTSALVGIAMKDGYIRDEEVKVKDIFAGRNILNMDKRKESMTLKDLLTMSSGLEWKEWYDNSAASSMTQINQNDDWIQYVLNCVMDVQPGTKFHYNSGVSHLLSGIIRETTGIKTGDYARERLFNVLGITDYFWQTDPQGNVVGGWGLWMKCRDMAKFGLLYLNKGKWEGKQIIPAGWVATSTKKQMEDRSSFYQPYDYGYQWWVDKKGKFYTAWGYGGQIVTVIPDKNLVIVTASMLPPQKGSDPITIASTLIANAVKSSSPLPENSEKRNQLAEAIKIFGAEPEIISITEIPQPALEISNKTFTFSKNRYNFESFSLQFDPENLSTACVTFRQGGDEDSFIMGLDNRYRVNQVIDNGPFLLKGHWED